MDRNTLLTIVLSMGIYAGWYKFYVEPRQQTVKIEETVVVAPKTTPHEPSKTQRISFGSGDVRVANGGGFLKEWHLKDYALKLNTKGAVDLDSLTHAGAQITLAFDHPDFAYLYHAEGQLTTTSINNVPHIEWHYSDPNVQLSKKFVPMGTNLAHLTIDGTFLQHAPETAFISLSGVASQEDADLADRQIIYAPHDDSMDRVPLSKTPIEQRALPWSLDYIGITNRYFLLALLSGPGTKAPQGLIQPRGTDGGIVSLLYPLEHKKFHTELDVYFGPKEHDVLRTIHPKLDQAIDFGWFGIVAKPISNLLHTLYPFVHNYGLAIILLTLLLKALTYPLTYQSMKNMKKMATIQPLMQKLRDEHKDNKEVLNKEMMILMRKHGYNPAAGCLPIFIQMPVFYALYRVLYTSIDLYHAPFVLWIQDLSSKDPWYVTPILLSGTMYLQQRLTPNTISDPVQAKMMQFMPLFFGVFMLGLPAGLTLYMLTNALASILQQLILNRTLHADK